jgi:dihydrolipoamide dehydrogenase
MVADHPPPARAGQAESIEEHVVSAPTSPADLVILGGGSGGYAAALRAAELGMSVVLIEKDKVGGTCLHRGCIPTKALLHSGEIADQAREGEQTWTASTPTRTAWSPGSTRACRA